MTDIWAYNEATRATSSRTRPCSIAWGRGRGRMLRSRSRKFWPRGHVGLKYLTWW